MTNEKQPPEHPKRLYCSVGRDWLISGVGDDLNLDSEEERAEEVIALAEKTDNNNPTL